MPCREKGGRGGRGGGGEGGGGVWCFPPTDTPNPLEEAKLHHLWVHTEGPPLHSGNFVGWGSLKFTKEGIKRWGIEGIRIGTSDRFGRGRGELGGFHFGIFSSDRRRSAPSRTRCNWAGGGSRASPNKAGVPTSLGILPPSCGRP